VSHARVRAVREGAGLFALSSRGVIEVGGDDRARWLNGMLTNDIEALDEGASRSGCYALLLTREGRLVTDLHVLALRDAILLELERGAVGECLAHLGKYIVADDVVPADRSEAERRLALEGPRAGEVLAAATGSRISLEEHAWKEVGISGIPVRVAAWSLSGEPGYQLFVPGEMAGAVREALRDAGRDRGLVEADEATLEVLRIEAGTPRFGCEIDGSVLPAEARLDRAIAKGCYLGQEVVERLRSRGRVGHLLVGLRFQADALPSEGSAPTGSRCG